MYSRSRKLIFLGIVTICVLTIIFSYYGTGLKYPQSFLPLCPEMFPQAVASQSVKDTAPDFDELNRKLGPSLQPGGVYHPPSCRARREMAIIVPCHDRTEHLRAFLQHMHPFLQRQQAAYTFFVVDQNGTELFNKARAMNAAVLEALAQYPYECFIFHDVDFLPENDSTLYTCANSPLNLIGTAVKGKSLHQPYYSSYFGGVAALTKEHFFRVNGYSNEYTGWGGEDDDMYTRITWHNLTVTRYSPEVAPYRMLEHEQTELNPRRSELVLHAATRLETDGLSNLKYRRIQLSKRPLYTWILVESPPSTEKAS